MSSLVDTNILTRIIHKTDPLHPAALGALAVLRRQNDDLFVVPQNLYELWVVCTRPAAQNGLGMSVDEIIAELVTLKQLFALLPDTATLFPEWERLVTQYQVVGKNAHDARLVAAMNVHGINRLLTFNAQDFQRYQGITILSPQQLVATP
jgi:predicted nucleic acid-binding protein